MKIETRETLAIEGGAPVRPSFLPYHQPLIDADDERAVVETLRSGWLTTGPEDEGRSSRTLAAYTGAAHCVAVNSCTAALHLALEAVGVGAGDEVITSPITFASTANVIVHRGARPVFVDVEPDTLNIDPAALERGDHAAHQGAHPGRLRRASRATSTRIMAIGAPARLPVIEDAAHAIGAEYKGRRVGGDRRHDLLLVLRHQEHHQRRGRRADDRTAQEWADRIAIMALHGISRDAWKRYGVGGLPALGHHRARLQVQHVRSAGARSCCSQFDKLEALSRAARRAEGAARRRPARPAGDCASRAERAGRPTPITCTRSSCAPKC